MEKEKVPTVFQKFTIFMERNNRAVEVRYLNITGGFLIYFYDYISVILTFIFLQFISYGITGIGLLFALYKIRPVCMTLFLL